MKEIPFSITLNKSTVELLGQKAHRRGIGIRQLILSLLNNAAREELRGKDDRSN